MQGSPPPRRILNRSTRSWLLIGMIAAVAVACQDSPTSPDEAKSIATHRVHPDCIEGCWGPDLNIVPSTDTVLMPPFGGSWHKDTLWLPDSTLYTPGDGTTVLLWFEVGPNTDDTSITVGTSVGYSCSNGCIVPTTLTEPTAGEITIESGDSAQTYAGFQTGPVGNGYITFSAGAGEIELLIHVYHCTYRVTCD